MSLKSDALDSGLINKMTFICMAGGMIHSITREDVDTIIDFIRDVVNGTGCNGLVVGASGGLDSAVTTKLCADAIGPENILNIFMPSANTPSEDRILTERLSKRWGTGYEVIGIQAAVGAFTRMIVSDPKAAMSKYQRDTILREEVSSDGVPVGIGNISARCRMTILYNRARTLNYLVAGTSNRSEYMMGYFTKFGDGASDLAPIIGLYKTQVRQMAEMISVPREVIEKVPTAGLWEGQTDEGEMGITYHDLDIVLNGIAFGLSDSEILKNVKAGTSKILEIRQRVAEMEHKRDATRRPDIIFNEP